ncbi:MAG: polysaccharide deacetylase family protein [Acidobacteriota bacterium]
MYHYVRDTPAGTRGVNALSLRDFDAQLDWLAAAWPPVDYGEFASSIADRRPLVRDASLLTFDDGFLDHRDAVWSRLVARGCTGVFFITGSALDDPPRLLNVHKVHLLIEALGGARFAEAVSEALKEMPSAGGLPRRGEVYRYDTAPDEAAIKHLLNYELPYAAADEVLTRLFTRHVGDEIDAARGLYLSASDVGEMSRSGMTFGFHTERHRVMSRLAGRDLDDEVARGVARIRALTGQASVPFCYPYGHVHTYTAATVAALFAAGYAMAFTTTRRIADPVSDGPFEIPRVDTRDLPPFTSGIFHA